MLQSLSIRLETQEDNVLLETMKRYNKACNFVAERAFVKCCKIKKQIQIT
jgi:predicted transposase